METVRRRSTRLVLWKATKPFVVALKRRCDDGERALAAFKKGGVASLVGGPHSHGGRTSEPSRRMRRKERGRASKGKHPPPNRRRCPPKSLTSEASTVNVF